MSAGVSGENAGIKMKVEQNNRIGFISMYEYSQTPTDREKKANWLMKHLHVGTHFHGDVKLQSDRFGDSGLDFITAFDSRRASRQFNTATNNS